MNIPLVSIIAGILMMLAGGLLIDLTDLEYTSGFCIFIGLCMTWIGIIEYD